MTNASYNIAIAGYMIHAIMNADVDAEYKSLYIVDQRRGDTFT